MDDVTDIDKAIDEYVRANAETGFVTGWILVASVSSPQYDIGSEDGYISVTSSGLPHHTQLGLLQVAQQDKQSVAVLNQLINIMDSRNDDEDWEDE